MGTTQLKYTPNSTSIRYKATISVWVKRTNIGAEGWIFEGKNGTGQADGFRFQANNTISMLLNDGGGGSCTTNRLFRDPNSFYHLMWVVDTTQVTASDRMKLYVNGVQETSFSSASYPAQNFAIEGTFVNGNDMYIGTQHGYNFFEGVMSHYHICDGYVYQPSDFGETDATTGEWKIKTSPSVSYGTHGAFILKDGNSVTDQSGNSNNWSVHGGTLTNLKDNPSNNFCNINTLYQQTTGEGVVVNNCGNTVYYASNASRSCFGSIAPSSGKYYFEAKVFGGTGTVVIGIVNMAWSGLNGAAGAFHDNALNFGYNVSGQTTSGGSNTAYGSSISDGDIVGVAMDLDNSKLYFSLNGVFQGSGDPTSGATGTGSAFNLASGANYTGACRLRNGTQVGFNFGNGQYSGSNVVTTNSGDGYSGAEGSSKFSYQPPANYSAISTKGLNL